MRWFAAWALVLAAVGSAAQAQVWVLDTEKASRSERVAAAAVQGLANRGGPRVYLQPGESCWCMNPKRAALPAEVAARCRSMADEWIHYGQTVHGLKFEPVADLGALVAKVRDAVRGVVLYDASYPGDFEIALTQAGLLDGVPLTAAMREANPVLRALPIVFDTAAAHGARSLTTKTFDVDPAGWAGGQVSVTRDGDATRFTLAADAKEPYSAAARRVELPFHAISGRVIIEVPRTDGQWSLKIARPGAGDEVIQRDTNATGRFEYDLSSVPNWQGDREVSLHMWVIGRGKSVWVKSVTAELRGGAQAPKEPLYDWALTNLLPRCSRDGLYSHCEPMDDFAVDVAVGEKLFVYDLSHASPDTVKEDYVREWLEKRPDGLNPPGAKQLDRILAHPKPLSPVWGWGKPSEQCYLFRLSQAGLVVQCGQIPNISFLTALKPRDKSVIGRHRPQPKVTLEDKVYVALLINEGDTAKCVGSLYNGGSWLQTARGSLPLNWGVSPYLCEKMPGVMERYYREAGPNDGFFMGPSGYGYAAAQYLPPAARELFAERTRHGVEVTGAPFADLWYFYPYQPEADRLAWLRRMGLSGVSLWHSDQHVSYPEGCPPLVHSNHYYEEGSAETLAQRIRRETGDIALPWFTIVYAGDPQWLSQVASYLPSERYKVVLLDEFYEAARQARAKVEGRVVKKG